MHDSARKSPTGTTSGGGVSAGPASAVPARHIPRRTCIGCRCQDDQAVLLRLVIAGGDGSNAVVVDERHRLSGRGAWLHPSPACMALALKRRAFNRAFKSAVDTREAESYFHAMERVPARNPLDTTVQPESGSED